MSDTKPQAGAVEKAMDWLHNRHRKGWQVCFQKLRDRLLSPAELAKLGRLDHQTLSGIQVNLTEWLLAEGQIQVQGSDRNICDYLISPTGPDWTVGQRAWLQQMGQRPLRLYTVTDVVPGVGVTLCDTLDADAAPVMVRELSGSHGLQPGEYLGTRLMRVGEHFELSGAAYVLSMHHGLQLADRLRAHAEEFPHAPDLAQRQAFVLMSFWIQLFVAPPVMPTIIDQYSGEVMVLITDHYRVRDWDALAHAFNACTDVEGDRQEGWSRILDCPDGQIRALAHINLSEEKEEIEVFYKTQTYADQGRVWFDAVTMGSVEFMTRKVVSPQSILERSQKEGASTKKTSTKAKSKSGKSKEMSPADLNSPELAQAMAAAVHRSYATWADDPIPVLNNQTPRQMVETAPGLERVKGLLRSYEANEKTQATQQGRGEVSYAFLWESLGLQR